MTIYIMRSKKQIIVERSNGLFTNSVALNLMHLSNEIYIGSYDNFMRCVKSNYSINNINKIYNLSDIYSMYRDYKGISYLHVPIDNCPEYLLKS